MNNMSRRKALQLMGGGMIGAAGLMIPKMAGASTKYQVKCITSWPSNAGATAQASSYTVGYEPMWANNGDRTGNMGLWKDSTAGVWGDWLQVTFNSTKTIDTIKVYTHQDGLPQNPGVEPTDTMTFTQNGLTAFDVQYWNGGSWITVGSVTGNNLVKRTFTFTAVQTSKIRVVANGGGGSSQLARIVELEAFSTDTSGSGGMPPYNVALAAPDPVVSGLDVVYSTLAAATSAKNDFAHYSDSVITPIYNNLGAPNPTSEYSIVTTTNQVTTYPQTVGMIYAANTIGQDPNTVLNSVNALPAGAVDPHNMKIQQVAPFLEAVTIFIGLGVGLIAVKVIMPYFTPMDPQLPTSQYWGWEGTITNQQIQLSTWGQIGGGGGPIHIPN